VASRDTTTGSNYESIIEACIKRSCEKNDLKAVGQAFVGIKPGGGNIKGLPAQPKRKWLTRLLNYFMR
jgi:hypothetical protein